MSMDRPCVFCRIVAGEKSAHKLYETSELLAFLDVHPTRKGHALIIPKEHYPTLFDLPRGFGSAMLEAAQMVGRAVMRACGATGLNVGMNVFEPAGQAVFHAHLHLIPREKGDGLDLWPQNSYDNDHEMARLAEVIRGHMS